MWQLLTSGPTQDTFWAREASAHVPEANVATIPDGPWVANQAISMHARCPCRKFLKHSLAGFRLGLHLQMDLHGESRVCSCRDRHTSMLASVIRWPLLAWSRATAAPRRPL